ncbi:MAG: hypothetical protein JSR58_01515 [Verrucomicrobia bacterium]|nr:hypothetical protein [Verrucomicrobiota bacterium]
MFLDEKDSYSLRAVRQALSIAAALVTEGGKFERAQIILPYAFHLDGFSDELLRRYQEKFLQRWRSDDRFFKSFQRFGLPLCHKGAEKLIYDSLGLSPGTPLSDAHVRRAVIAAALVPLRQNVGSCFATAPAILIQEEQLDRFLLDLYDLLTTGRMRRVIAGKECSVPLSLSWGGKEGDLALLKAWEFTLASYSEIKMEFSRWNLYVSLGLHPSEKGGIGEVVYRLIEEKLKSANEKLQEYGEEYNLAIDQVRMVESMLSNVDTQAEARRLKAEYQARYYHLQACRELVEDFQERAKRFANFFSYLTQQYDRKFPEYFQEIYDPEMAGLQPDAYEDSPAGFRLVYKHGRADASIWSVVRTPEDYIRSLVDFFTLSEASIVHGCESEVEKGLAAEITTTVIQHVRSEEFLKSAVARSKKMGRTPWAYVSGGTMETLVKTYFAKEAPLHQESRKAENPLDLCLFLLETLKSLPPKITNAFVKDKGKSMLMQSPTHAFLLKPGITPFSAGWQDRGFTYTWVRDNFLIPMQEFYERHMPKESKLSDAELFQSLPFVSRSQCQAVLQELLSPWKVTPTLPKNLPSQLTALDVKNLAKLHLQDITDDVHGLIAERARAIGFAPRILTFADTNWLHFYFAFIVNPRTKKLELWRVDRTGTVGAPMTSWNDLFPGKDVPWTVYVDTADYS